MSSLAEARCPSRPVRQCSRQPGLLRGQCEVARLRQMSKYAYNKKLRRSSNDNS